MKIEDIKLGTEYKVVIPENTPLTSFKNHISAFNGQKIQINGVYKGWTDYSQTVIDLGMYYSIIQGSMIYFPLDWLEEDSLSKDICTCPTMTLMQTGYYYGHIKKP